MKRIFTGLIVLGLIGLGVFWWVTRPEALALAPSDTLAGDAEAGRLVYLAAGCGSCHHAPGAEGDDKLVLAGGQRFPSDFGTFIAPNISPHPDAGIGNWTEFEIAQAVLKGVSPDGQHYFPAFPYTSYQRMKVQDVADLIAYLRTLPESDAASLPHDVAFPFNVRRSIGGWKFLFGGAGWASAASENAQLNRGRYLVEALSHCGECHTPRNALGGLAYDSWLTGAPIPGSEKGRTPGIAPSQLDWSEADIAEYLKSGFTPDFDSAGGHMVEVIENYAQLSQEDRDAVAAYLKALP